MKNMKRIIGFITILLVVFGMNLMNQPVQVHALDQHPTASGTNTSTNQGLYRVLETMETNLLPYGVRHFKDRGESTTSQAIGGRADGVYGKISDLFQPGQMYEQQVNLLEVPSTQGVKIVSWANLNNHKWTMTTVRSLIYDYEIKNPGWKVIGAINGDWSDARAAADLPYQMYGPHVSQGDYYRTTTTTTHYYLGFPNDGSTNSMIPGVFVQKSPTMKLSIYGDEGEITHTMNVEKYNQTPSAGETAVYYGGYNSNKDYVSIQMNAGSMQGYYIGSAELALPNNPNDFYGRGVITSTPSSMVIEKGQFGLVSDNPVVNEALEVGKRIRVQWEMAGPFDGIETVSGAGARFLLDGEYVFNSVLDRHPRSFIGRKSDGTIVMAVVDGRQGDQGMHGMHGSELAATMRRYGVVEAFTLDGGGSSTLLIRKGDNIVLTNSPSDGWERSIANALFVVARDPDLEVVDIESTTNTLTFEIDLQEHLGHDIQEMMVQVGLSSAVVAQGKATFTGLRADTEYDYVVRYRDSSGKFISTKLEGSIMTLKSTPTFRKVNVTENAESFTFQVDYTDRSGAGNFATAQLTVNGYPYQLSGGSVTVLKEDVGALIHELRLEYQLDFNNNVMEYHNVLNPHFRATLALNKVVDDIKASVKKIYE